MACGGTFAVVAQLRGTSHHHILGRVYVPIRFADVHGQEKLNAQYMTPTDYLTEKEPYIQYVNLDFSPKKLAGLCELGLLTITGRLLCTELSKAQEQGAFSASDHFIFLGALRALFMNGQLSWIITIL
jgi:hypothetical protein